MFNMQWDYFIGFSLSSLACWTIAAILAYKGNEFKKSVFFMVVGLIIFAAFIAGMWISLERPPLTTMGETRLWYSFFLPLVGLVIYIKRKYKWILSLTILLSVVFICINIFNPEIHHKILMPALQSIWFIPHVVVYIFAYSLVGIATVNALLILILRYNPEKEISIMHLCDDLVNFGTAFLTIGLLLGSIWAKEAWGRFWSWDPKETWAAATVIIYLIYIHLRYHNPTERKIAAFILIFAFIILQMCWFGVNYLPSAKEGGLHVYR
ncbi:MAG: cytochrome c biogenesis protein CcsA [Marinilabiliaceae bacterium]|nr:cytochrome c biogenesis protein CcsA [Marinilabiliaceae bacterium]